MMRISIIVDVLLLLVSPTPGYGAVPAQVTDLEAVFHNNHLDIKFTSPNTPVAKFIIKYAETSEDLQGSNFANDDLNASSVVISLVLLGISFQSLGPMTTNDAS